VQKSPDPPGPDSDAICADTDLGADLGRRLLRAAQRPNRGVGKQPDPGWRRGASANLPRLLHLRQSSPGGNAVLTCIGISLTAAVGQSCLSSRACRVTG